MKLESKLSPGDIAYCLQNLEIVVLTVGEVRVIVRNNCIAWVAKRAVGLGARRAMAHYNRK